MSQQDSLCQKCGLISWSGHRCAASLEGEEHMSDIWKRRYEIDKARREKMKEVMDEYDRKVYNPARKQLVEDCEKEGHTHGKFHDNGLGWTWWWCGKCGTSFDKQGPDGIKENT